MFLQLDFLLGQSSVFIQHMGASISGVTHFLAVKNSVCNSVLITRVTNKVAPCFSDQSNCISRLEFVTNNVALCCSDQSNCVSRLEFDAIIRLDDIMRHSQQKLSVVEVSARDGQGLAKVVQWIKEHAKPQT